jgi:hypothetical protein
MHIVLLLNGENFDTVYYILQCHQLLETATSDV